MAISPINEKSFIEMLANTFIQSYASCLIVTPPLIKSRDYVIVQYKHVTLHTLNVKLDNFLFSHIFSFM